MKDPRDEIIQKFFKGLFLGDINELRECEAMIDEYEKNKEETTQEIDARFLRGKQEEIDNLRKQLEREERKSKYYSDLCSQQGIEIDKLLAENQRLLDLINKKGPQGATGASN